ncbi:YgjV family protein [Rhodoferax sp.]|uniref:YgjV family protein n=1 Tax=Rhodoferax sp. TaxID=50421 RepID=UPI00284703E5|nr:YgjV family protein [Rhodoferax sp.]MDR3369239.1 YgjV family protein [Rhodoferax sp.]
MFDHWLDTAQWFGYTAFVLGVTSFLQKNDVRFKLYMSAECIAYVVHFTLLGNPAAGASSLVSMTRSLVSIYSKSLWIAFFFVAINMALGLRLATVWWNWLPLIASCVGTLALFLLDGIQMRMAMLVGTSLWIANNVLSGSIGGTALEVVIAITNSYTIIRLHVKSREPKAAFD